MSGRKSFRIGRVRGDLRGKIWYLAYYENGQRQRPRIGPSKDAARQMAAEINAQLETGAPSALNFEPVPIAALQRRWLDHHEHVLRSSVRTIVRYRCATKHFVDFVESLGTIRTTAQFQVHHAERFVRYLRSLRVAPNGHPNAAKRPLLDNGIKYILETSRTLFNYGIKRRHLPPYAESPFGSLDLDRIPVENAKPIVVFSPDQEQQLLDACDDWQFPLFSR